MKPTVIINPVVATTTFGQAIAFEPPAPDPSIRAASIIDLPIDWDLEGVTTQSVRAFAAYKTCVEQNALNPDVCITNSTLTLAEGLGAVFEILYWLPDIETALFYQLEEFKPKDCSAEQLRCHASTPEDGICPPWRRVVPEAAPSSSPPPETTTSALFTSKVKTLAPTTGAPSSTAAATRSASYTTVATHAPTRSAALQSSGTPIYSGSTKTATDNPENVFASSSSKIQWQLSLVSTVVFGLVGIALY